MTDHTRASSQARLHRRRRCCSSSRLAGLSKHETAKAGNTFGIAGMAIALVATIALAVDRGRASTALASSAAADRRRDGHRRRDRPVAGPRRRDDRHARADRAAAQLRRPGRRARRLERLLPRATGGELRRHRCGIHDVEVFVGVFIGAVTFTGSIVAFLKLSARIKSAPLMLPGTERAQPRRARRRSSCSRSWFVDRRRTLVAARRGHRARAGCSAGTWSPRSAAATCRSSCRCSTATPAGPRRPSGFLLGNDLLIITGALVGSSGALPVLHHVQGDEPLVHLGHRRRLRRRGRHRRRRRRTTASTARSPPRAPPSCSPRRTR